MFEEHYRYIIVISQCNNQNIMYLERDEPDPMRIRLIII